MTRLLSVFLGILTAIGGFVDIGDLVANALVGSRFGLSLAWATLIGVVGICVFAEMSGRVAAVTGRGTFDLIRERLGARVGLLNLAASLLVTVLTFTAEVGGVALSLELATSVNYLLFAPVVGFAVWLVIWRVKFSTLENVFGLLGLALVVFGTGLMINHSAREDRQRLEALLQQMVEEQHDGGLAAQVPADADGLYAAGTTSYHRPGCRLVDGREEVAYVTAEEAAARDLKPCRVCHPETTHTTNVTIR